MRLKPDEVHAIKTTIRNLDQDADVFLFGSRVDDSKRGGDIDLLVFSAKLSGGDAKRAIKKELYKLIGEQKIDIVLAVDATDPFVQLALKTGVKL
ncbi:nucleotidyltransferase domain-containing protein [Geomonas edaphica]|uniref:nucleotidyltransferase domain-containing protein n=1 Tax=Geomonas edaphica TaxID=2570226 RepID=UPI0010A7E570|nr:nucleotidyltransferase domain-containing protein [Geomonas edaphica]